MLDLFKPYQFVNSLKTPLIFNEVEQPYNPIFKSFRPFIIFYDDTEHQYWYLKARTKTEKSKKQEFEVLVPKNDATDAFKSALLWNDSYVDCSQIFKIDAELLESLVDKQNPVHIKTKVLDSQYIDAILETINECCNEIPPNLSILEVKMDESGQTYATSLYLSEEKIKEVEIKIERDEYPVEFMKDIESFESKPNGDALAQNRYDNGIKFVEDFQYQYFKYEWSETDYEAKYYKPFEKQQEYTR